MTKPDFKKSTEEATKLLSLQHNITSHIDVTKLNYDKEIYFFSIQEYCKFSNTPITDFISPKHKCLVDGCTYIYDGAHLVLHNDKPQTKEHLNWTRAHEIGHIYMGHTADGDIEEIEAHFFAAQFLMPMYSIVCSNIRYGKMNYKNIMDIFGVSKEAAIKRKRTMENFCFSDPSQEDWNIWKMQEKFIDNYYEGLSFTSKDIYVVNI